MAKAHGLRGETVVELTTNRTERIDAGTVLALDDGTELRVRTSSPMGGARARFLVSFDGVAGRDAADALRGRALLAAPIADPDQLWVHELIGSTVHDTDGVARGRVVSVESNPASDLLVTDTGALIPLRFVVAAGDGRVEVDVPAGLFDL